MENVLQSLFDFQRFEQNADLQRVIDSVHASVRARQSRPELSLDDAEWVAAAGMPGVSQDQVKKEQQEL